MNKVFKALSDPTRRQVLQLLRDRHMSAGELSDHFPVSKPTMSAHFAVLREAGLIEAEKVTTWASLGSMAAAEVPERPTFSKDVLPILQQRCQDCHRVGGVNTAGMIAPMASLTAMHRHARMRNRIREVAPIIAISSAGAVSDAHGRASSD